MRPELDKTLCDAYPQILNELNRHPETCAISWEGCARRRLVRHH